MTEEPTLDDVIEILIQRASPSMYCTIDFNELIIVAGDECKKHNLDWWDYLKACGDPKSDIKLPDHVKKNKIEREPVDLAKLCEEHLSQNRPEECIKKLGKWEGEKYIQFDFLQAIAYVQMDGYEHALKIFNNVFDSKEDYFDKFHVCYAHSLTKKEFDVRERKNQCIKYMLKCSIKTGKSSEFKKKLIDEWRDNIGQNNMYLALGILHEMSEEYNEAINQYNWYMYAETERDNDVFTKD
ncbi:hypothetical protein KY312_00140, partial [Candidatus Woesearchaeota archaeon]|nr:hypothetical protein [Candidatus Woesearchaeota archaeon]